MRNFPSLLGLLLLVRSCLAAALAWPPTIACSDFAFEVSTISFNDTGVIQPAATYNLSATYCPPSKFVRHRASTVQLLLHGGTLNKLYWSALAPVGSITEQYKPGNYSYVDFARSEGYHTIAIDRLGAGNSSHPDPAIVRAGLQAELTNTVIEQIRNISQRQFPNIKYVILVGHSYGAFVANIMLNKYPKAVDGLVLTGYLHIFPSDVPEIPQEIAPGSEVKPEKFGNLDPGYLTIANEQSHRDWFYSVNGSFDPEALHQVYLRQDVQAIGEMTSLNEELAGSFTTDTTLYSGPMAVMIGREDYPFCRGDCWDKNTSFIPLSQPFFPNVSRYTGFFLENTGHLLHYHYTAPEGFAMVHKWLESSGF